MKSFVAMAMTAALMSSSAMAAPAGPNKADTPVLATVAIELDETSHRVCDPGT